MHFGSRIYQYENAFIDDLAKLISIPSVCTTATEDYPFGGTVGQSIKIGY